MDVVGHPVELISHGLGGNTRASGRDGGSVGGRLGCHSMDSIRSGGVRGVVRLYVSEVVPELLRRWSKNENSPSASLLEVLFIGNSRWVSERRFKARSSGPT